MLAGLDGLAMQMDPVALGFRGGEVVHEESRGPGVLSGATFGEMAVFRDEERHRHDDAVRIVLR